MLIIPLNFSLFYSNKKKNKTKQTQTNKQNKTKQKNRLQNKSTKDRMFIVENSSKTSRGCKLYQVQGSQCFNE